MTSFLAMWITLAGCDNAPACLSITPEEAASEQAKLDCAYAFACDELSAGMFESQTACEEEVNMGYLAEVEECESQRTSNRRTVQAFDSCDWQADAEERRVEIKTCEDSPSGYMLSWYPGCMEYVED